MTEETTAVTSHLSDLSLCSITDFFPTRIPFHFDPFGGAKPAFKGGVKKRRSGSTPAYRQAG
jgi:hypothetical protein